MKRVYCKTVLAVLLGCVQGVFSLGCAWLLMTAVDIITGENADLMFFDFCLLALAYYFGYLIIFGLHKKAYISAARQFRLRMKERLFAGVLWVSPAAHRKSTEGDVLSKFQYELDMLEKAFYEPMFLLIKNIVTTLVSFGAVLFLQPYVAVLLVVALAGYLLATKNVNKKIETLQMESAQANAGENNEACTVVKAYATARNHGQEEFFLSRYAKCAETQAVAMYRCNFAYDLLAVLSSNLESIITLLIIFVGGLLLETRSFSFTAGGLLGITQLASSVIGPVGSIGTNVARIKGTGKVREGLWEFENTGLKTKGEWTARKAGLPKLEKISLQNVSVYYEDNAVLEDVSLELVAGRKYALIGASGSGKTTLAKLLLKQIAPVSGVISWNDISYAGVGTGELLEKFGYVAQQPMIFQKNIRENITAGARKNEKRLESILKRSGLEKLRNQAEQKEISEIAAWKLSGGEKKRVALARAMYKECEVLILDEVTSSVHDEMAFDLEQELLRNEQRMIIYVTHRLNVKNALFFDEVIEICNGRVKIQKSEEWANEVKR